MFIARVRANPRGAHLWAPTESVALLKELSDLQFSFEFYKHFTATQFSQPTPLSVPKDNCYPRSFLNRSAASISVSSFLQKQKRTCCEPSAGSL